MFKKDFMPCCGCLTEWGLSSAHIFGVLITMGWMITFGNIVAGIDICIVEFLRGCCKTTKMVATAPYIKNVDITTKNHTIKISKNG